MCSFPLSAVKPVLNIKHKRKGVYNQTPAVADGRVSPFTLPAWGFLGGTSRRSRPLAAGTVYGWPHFWLSSFPGGRLLFVSVHDRGTRCSPSPFCLRHKDAHTCSRTQLLLPPWVSAPLAAAGGPCSGNRRVRYDHRNKRPPVRQGRLPRQSNGAFCRLDRGQSLKNGLPS